MEKVRVVKLEEREDAEVPNNKEIGYEKIGTPYGPPKVGECFLMATYRGYWTTSIVTEILSEDTFKTKNSIYKIIPIENELLSDQI